MDTLVGFQFFPNIFPIVNGKRAKPYVVGGNRVETTVSTNSLVLIFSNTERRWQRRRVITSHSHHHMVEFKCTSSDDSQQSRHHNHWVLIFSQLSQHHLVENTTATHPTDSKPSRRRLGLKFSPPTLPA